MRMLVFLHGCLGFCVVVGFSRPY